MGLETVIATGKQVAAQQLLLSEDFESPVVSGYSEGTAPGSGNWVLSDTGFNGDRVGLVNKDLGEFITTHPDDAQGIATQYTNAGLCSDAGVIEEIDIYYQTYRVVVDVVYDQSIDGSGGPSGDYRINLYALPSGWDRSDLTGSLASWLPYKLTEAVSSVADDGKIHRILLEYTTDPVTDISHSGNDLTVLIVGNTSSAIITNVEVYKTGGSGGNWTPLSAGTDLVAWYDAADAATVTESSGNVSQWDDKSGNGYHLDQSPSDPEWGLGAQINGMNVMYYSSTVNRLYRDSIPDINCTALALISVGEAKSAGDYPAMGVVKKTDETDGMSTRTQCSASNGKTSSSLRLGGSSVSMVSATTVTAADDNPYLVSVWYDGNQGLARINGGLVSDTTDTVDNATFTINEIWVGREPTFQSNTPKNYHGEFVVLKTAAIDTIRKVEGYLAWKWGTVGNLEASHPYKSAAPTK